MLRPPFFDFRGQSSLRSSDLPRRLEMRRTRNVNGDGKAEIVVAKRGDHSVSILQGKSIPQPCLRHTVCYL
jgi:hypothetical protein